MKAARRSYAGIVAGAWGKSAPDYATALARELDAGTAWPKLEERIGYSKKTLLGVLEGTYGQATRSSTSPDKGLARPAGRATRGNLPRVAEAIQGALLGRNVHCPAAGEITRADCLRHQSRPHDPTSALHVAIYRACRSGCAHSELPPYDHVRRAKAATTTEPEQGRRATPRRDDKRSKR